MCALYRFIKIAFKNKNCRKNLKKTTMTTYLRNTAEKWGDQGLDFAKQQFSDLPRHASTHFPHFMKGLSYATTGLLSQLRTDTDMNQRYWKFIKEAYLPVLGTLYGIFAVFAFFFFPLTIAVIILAPALLFQLLSTISVWGLHIAQKRHPIDHGLLFIEGLKQVDPQLAQDFSNTMQNSNIQHRSWLQAIRDSLDDKMYFWSLSLAFSILSFVPILGSIFSVIAHTYLASHKMAYRLLDTYMTIENMNSHQQLQFVNKYWSLLFGFCFPYVFLSSIPFVGPLILGYAEVAAAKLFYFEIYKKSKQESESRIGGSA
jgi:hypothetical protein